jgi:hypothetical protein
MAKILKQELILNPGEAVSLPEALLPVCFAFLSVHRRQWYQLLFCLSSPCRNEFFPDTLIMQKDHDIKSRMW